MTAAGQKLPPPPRLGGTCIWNFVGLSLQNSPIDGTKGGVDVDFKDRVPNGAILAVKLSIKIVF